MFIVFGIIIFTIILYVISFADVLMIKKRLYNNYGDHYETLMGLAITFLFVISPLLLLYRLALRPSYKAFVRWQERKIKKINEKAERKFIKKQQTLAEKCKSLRLENKRLEKRLKRLNEYKRTDIMDI